ncbi:MAG: hypothetical protein ACRCT7_03835, partial [Shewanella sp.]
LDQDYIQYANDHIASQNEALLIHKLAQVLTNTKAALYNINQNQFDQVLDKVVEVAANAILKLNSDNLSATALETLYVPVLIVDGDITINSVIQQPLQPNFNVSIDQLQAKLDTEPFKFAQSGERSFSLAPMFMDRAANKPVVASYINADDKNELSIKGIGLQLNDANLVIFAGEQVPIGDYVFKLQHDEQAIEFTLKVVSDLPANTPILNLDSKNAIQAKLNTLSLQQGVALSTPMTIGIGELFSNTEEFALSANNTGLTIDVANNTLEISGTPSIGGFGYFTIETQNQLLSTGFNVAIKPADNVDNTPDSLAKLLSEKTVYHFSAYQADAIDWLEGIFQAPDTHTFYQCNGYKFIENDGQKELWAARSGHIVFDRAQFERPSMSKCPTQPGAFAKIGLWEVTAMGIKVIPHGFYGKELMSELSLLADNHAISSVTDSMTQLKLNALYRVREVGDWGVVSYKDKAAITSFYIIDTNSGSESNIDADTKQIVEKFWQEKREHNIYFNNKVWPITVSTQATSSYDFKPEPWNEKIKTVASRIQTDVVFHASCDDIGLKKDEGIYQQPNDYIKPSNWAYDLLLLHPRLKHEKRAISSMKLDFAQYDQVANTCTIRHSENGLIDENPKMSLLVGDDLVVYFKKSAQSAFSAEDAIINTTIMPNPSLISIVTH